MTRRALLLLAAGLIGTLAVSSLARIRYVLRVIPFRCVGCGDCARVCPVHAVLVRKGKAFIDAEICNGCLLCEAACSYGAIKRCIKEND